MVDHWYLFAALCLMIILTLRVATSPQTRSAKATAASKTIERLERLRDSGALTDAEFARMARKVLRIDP